MSDLLQESLATRQLRWTPSPTGSCLAETKLFFKKNFLRKISPKWAWLLLWLGMICGVLMGIVRMAQGGHFATDLLWAGGLVYLLGLVLSS